MNRQIFIDTLRRALYGKLDEGTLQGHIRYYENYFLQEEALGRSEQEILEELGDPRLIARTILEAAGGGADYREYTVEEDGTYTEEKIRVSQVPGWKVKAALIAGILILVLILILVFHLVAALLPFLLVAGLVWWIVKNYGSR